MLFGKDSHEEDAVLQSQFTSYIVRAVRNRRIDYLDALKRSREYEIGVDAIDLYEHQANYAVSDDPEKKVLHSLGAFDNETLEHALIALSERERNVLFARILLERSYQELSAELGIGYKGVTAIYRRAKQRIKDEMEEER